MGTIVLFCVAMRWFCEVAHLPGSRSGVGGSRRCCSSSFTPCRWGLILHRGHAGDRHRQIVPYRSWARRHSAVVCLCDSSRSFVHQHFADEARGRSGVNWRSCRDGSQARKETGGRFAAPCMRAIDPPVGRDQDGATGRRMIAQFQTIHAARSGTGILPVGGATWARCPRHGSVIAWGRSYSLPGRGSQWSVHRPEHPCRRRSIPSREPSSGRTGCMNCRMNCRTGCTDYRGCTAAG